MGVRERCGGVCSLEVLLIEGLEKRVHEASEARGLRFENLGTRGLCVVECHEGGQPRIKMESNTHVPWSVASRTSGHWRCGQRTELVWVHL